MFDPARAGHLGQRTQHTTHTKNISLRCALGCGKKIPPKKNFSSLQNHKIQTAALQIKRRYELHPGTQTTSLWFILGHTPTPTHTTLLVVASKHRLAAMPPQRWWCMRWNVCASAVRFCSCGAFETTNTTHTRNSSLRCALGCGKKIPPKNPSPHPCKTIKFKRLRFKSNGATNYTPGTHTTDWWFILGHTPTPTHTTPLVVASKHRSAALPPERWWCMRWNVCASAVRSCSCGAIGTTNTTHNTHQKHFTSFCPGLRKKIPPKNSPRPYKIIKFKLLRFKSNGATNYTLARKQRAAHTAHPLFLSLV